MSKGNKAREATIAPVDLSLRHQNEARCKVKSLRLLMYIRAYIRMPQNARHGVLLGYMSVSLHISPVFILCSFAGQLFLEPKIHQGFGLLCRAILCISCCLLSFLFTTPERITIFIKAESLEQTLEGICRYAAARCLSMASGKIVSQHL